MNRLKLLVTAALALLCVGTQAQTFNKAGVFPGRLTPDIVITPPPPVQEGLSPPWQQSVIGSGTGGVATSAANILTDVCKGDVDVMADSGNFVYQSISGDKEMVGQLQGIASDQVWARYAPRVAQSTAAGSKYAGLFFDHRNFFAFNWRTALDGANGAVAEIAYTIPQWWRIVRVGDVFSGYVGPSSAGPWTLNGSQTVVMSDPVLWGVLCVNGNDPAVATETSTLPNLQAVSGGAGGTAQFTTDNQTVNENGSAFGVTVSRVGGSTGAGSIVVSRAGTSTAALTTDYTISTPLPATLNWTGGDTTTRTLTVTPVNRSGVQSSRHLDLSLGTASGVQLGSPGTQIITINDVSGGATTKWNPGFYGDCFTEMSSHIQVAIGNAEHSEAKACMDYWATQTPTAKGVFIDMTWDSYAGDTIDCFTSACSNKLGAAGKIGYPLVDDLLAYAASKGLKVILGFAWLHHGNYGGCTTSSYLGSMDAYFPLYLTHTGICGGTDAAGTYGVLFDTGAMVAELWKAAVMDRYIAMLQAYGDRYDSNPALEMILLETEEGDYPNTTAALAAGYSSNAQGVQQARTTAAKPHWAHTNIAMSEEWVDPVANQVSRLNAGYMTQSAAIGYYQNDHYADLGTWSGAAGFVGYTGACGGGGTPCWGNVSTRDFRSTLPSVVKPTDELCGLASVGGGHAYETPQQFWDAAYTTGYVGSGVATRPTHWIFGRTTGINFCPGSPDQQWGTISSGGWFQFLQTHPIPPVAAACPSAYAGCAP